MNAKFDLEVRLLDYAADIVRFTDEMNRSPAGVHVAGQLLPSGTAALPNNGEAQAAESRADFVHKMSLCLKELRESRRWLLLARRVPLVKLPDTVVPLLRENDELIRIFFASIDTARKRALIAKANER